MKSCSKCGESKPDDVFVPGTRTCKACRSEYRRAYYARNREAAIANATAWNQANRDRHDAARKKWQEANPDAARLATRRRLADPEARERKRDYARQWRARNKHRTTIYSWRAAQRRRGAQDLRVGDLGEWAAVLRCDPCSYCGGAGGEVDHIVPVAASGLAEQMNLAGSCRSCNASKYQKSLLTFLLHRS